MLWSRNDNNISASFPEIVDALRSVLDHRKTVLDGEIVALGPDGVPSFSLLQRRMHVLRPTAQLRNEVATSYYVFDVLDIDGTSCDPRTHPTRRTGRRAPASTQICQMGIAAGLGERPENGIQAHQCPQRNRHRETIIQKQCIQTARHHSGQWILRVDEK